MSRRIREQATTPVSHFIPLVDKYIPLSPTSPNKVIHTTSPRRLRRRFAVQARQILTNAIREAREETAVELMPEEIMLCSNQRRTKDGTYYPYLCLAQVSEEKLDTHPNVADENGKPIKVADFQRAEVSTMVDLLDRHRGFVKALEEVSMSLLK